MRRKTEKEKETKFGKGTNKFAQEKKDGEGIGGQYLEETIIFCGGDENRRRKSKIYFCGGEQKWRRKIIGEGKSPTGREVEGGEGKYQGSIGKRWVRQ